MRSRCRHVQTQRIPVTLAERPYPFPSRTRKSSSPAPKILRGQPFGKIGRRRDFCVSCGNHRRSYFGRGGGILGIPMRPNERANRRSRPAAPPVAAVCPYLLSEDGALACIDDRARASLHGRRPGSRPRPRQAAPAVPGRGCTRPARPTGSPSIMGRARFHERHPPECRGTARDAAGRPDVAHGPRSRSGELRVPALARRAAPADSCWSASWASRSPLILLARIPLGTAATTTPVTACSRCGDEVGRHASAGIRRAGDGSGRGDRGAGQGPWCRPRRSPRRSPEPRPSRRRPRRRPTRSSAGDTLSGIALKFKTTWQVLAELNGLKDAGALRVGQVLQLP